MRLFHEFGLFSCHPLFRSSFFGTRQGFDRRWWLFLYGVISNDAPRGRCSVRAKRRLLSAEKRRKRDITGAKEQIKATGENARRRRMLIRASPFDKGKERHTPPRESASGNLREPFFSCPAYCLFFYFCFFEIDKRKGRLACAYRQARTRETTHAHDHKPSGLSNPPRRGVDPRRPNRGPITR